MLTKSQSLVIVHHWLLLLLWRRYQDHQQSLVMWLTFCGLSVQQVLAKSSVTFATTILLCARTSERWKDEQKSYSCLHRGGGERGKREKSFRSSRWPTKRFRVQLDWARTGLKKTVSSLVLHRSRLTTMFFCIFCKMHGTYFKCLFSLQCDRLLFFVDDIKVYCLL